MSTMNSSDAGSRKSYCDPKTFAVLRYLAEHAGHYMEGRPEKAIAPLGQFLSHYPNNLFPHLTLAAVYNELGKEAEARAEAAEVLRLNPNFSLEVHKEREPMQDLATLERDIAPVGR